MKCKLCGKEPHELREYATEAKAMKITPEEYVRREEGTYNPKTDLFYCTPCYVKAGMPLGTA
jgi:hypothetical protein